MRAIVCAEYGPPDVLRYTEDAPQPVPKDDEVLLRVHAASVNPLDWRVMRGMPWLMRPDTGLRKPKATGLGVDVAGIVEAAGRNVTRFQPGDAVFGTAAGAFAEYACAPEKGLALKPANLTFEQAAAVPVGALTSLQGLRDKGKLQPGQKVLINGAAGGVGTFAVQIARSLGADVTGVCSTRNVDLVRSIGAHHVVDYTRENFTASGQRYDLILDMMGNHSLSDRRRALTARGTLVLIGSPEKGGILGPVAGMLKAALVSPFVSQRLIPLMSHVSRDDLLVMRDLLAAGTVVPVIDRSYPLPEVPSAIRYLEAGHARGKVVITMG